MKRLLRLFLIIILLTGLTCCCPCRHLTTGEQQVSADSLRIEYRERIIYVPDTVLITIPAQTAERTTPDSISHLENDFAESDARINADGTLFHSLNTKPQEMEVPTQKQIEQRDSIVYRDRWLQRTITRTVTVKQDLSWWQKTQIYGFWVFILLMAFLHRKKITSLIRRLL